MTIRRNSNGLFNVRLGKPAHNRSLKALGDHPAQSFPILCNRLF